jgi:hypothetical protein
MIAPVALAYSQVNAGLEMAGISGDQSSSERSETKWGCGRSLLGPMLPELAESAGAELTWQRLGRDPQND